MTKIDLNALSADQLKELEGQLKDRKASEALRIQQEKDAYKDLKDEAILDAFILICQSSIQMMESKDKVFHVFDGIIDMKDELFKTKSDRQSDTMTTDDGKISIKLGTRINDGWADEHEIGIAKVKEYLRTLAKDEDSADLIDTIMKLVSKDSKGNLKASKVLELEQLAVKRNDPTFTEGINIIKEAYRPVPTCQFVEARFKDKQGKYRSVPTSMSVANDAPTIEMLEELVNELLEQKRWGQE